MLEWLYRKAALRESAVSLGFEHCAGSNERRTDTGRCSVCGVPVKAQLYLKRKQRGYGLRAVSHNSVRRAR